MLEYLSEKLCNMKRIQVVMTAFGLAIGLVFPYVVDPFVTWKPESKLFFRLACIVAGLSVGTFCYYLIKVTLYQRNLMLACKKEELESAKERFSRLTYEAIAEGKWDVSFHDDHVPTCWEEKGCQLTECPLYGEKHIRCWLVAGTFCRGEVQGPFAQKLGSCSQCEVYQAAIGSNPFDEIGENFNSLMWAVREREDLLAEANTKLQSQYQELEELHNQAREMAITDALTKLRNHGHFQQQLKAEAAKAKRYNRPLALLMLDLDHFKEINDRFGHQKGDAVLSCLGELLAAEKRDVDYAARYGGEEFAIIMPETTGAEAVEMAERLRSRIPRIAEGAELSAHFISASFGVADMPACTNDSAALVCAADGALYSAKRNGRNRVAYYRDLPASEQTAGGGGKVRRAG